MKKSSSGCGWYVLIFLVSVCVSFCYERMNSSHTHNFKELYDISASLRRLMGGDNDIKDERASLPIDPHIYNDESIVEEEDDIIRPYSVDYVGTVANQDVHMFLTFYPSGIVEGRYMYRKYGSWLDLSGTFTDDEIKLTEFDGDRQTGTFILRIDTDENDNFRIVGSMANSKDRVYEVYLYIE